MPTCPYCNKRFLLNVVPVETTPIPKAELELFKQLQDLKVIFDVGARTDVEYLELWPEAQHHLFEPNPEFFKELEVKVNDKPNVHANNIGLGDREELKGYHGLFQSFVGSGKCPEGMNTDLKLPIQTLTKYATDKGITSIDFLKVDTEGHDLKVLLGAYNFRHNIKYIQYEHWGDVNNKLIMGLLQDDFEMYNVGYRNMFCMNKELVSEEERARLREYIEVNKLCNLV